MGDLLFKIISIVKLYTFVIQHTEKGIDKGLGGTRIFGFKEKENRAFANFNILGTQRTDQGFDGVRSHLQQRTLGQFSKRPIFIVKRKSQSLGKGFGSTGIFKLQESMNGHFANLSPAP